MCSCKLPVPSCTFWKPHIPCTILWSIYYVVQIGRAMTLNWLHNYWLNFCEVQGIAKWSYGQAINIQGTTVHSMSPRTELSHPCPERTCFRCVTLGSRLSPSLSTEWVQGILHGREGHLLFRAPPTFTSSLPILSWYVLRSRWWAVKSLITGMQPSSSLLSCSWGVLEMA